MWGELHESKQIVIKLPEVMNAGKGNRLFRELGATLYYDVYSFEASEYKNWQSETLLSVDLLHAGKEVDAQDDFEEIILTYFFASRPSSDQKKALTLISKIIRVFSGIALYNGNIFSIHSVQTDWDKCNDFLLKEWGEEPGSKSLAIMIHENYA